MLEQEFKFKCQLKLELELDQQLVPELESFIQRDRARAKARDQKYGTDKRQKSYVQMKIALSALSEIESNKLERLSQLA